MFPAHYNLLITQGTELSARIQLLEGPYIYGNATAAGVTAISLYKPLRQALFSNAKLLFGDVTATLSAGASLGASSVSVSALALPITRGPGQKLTNVSNYTFTCSIYDTTGANVDTITVATVSASEGLISLSLTDTETSALTANLEIGTSLTEAQVQAWEPTGTEYQWRLNARDAEGVDRRLINGVVLVAPSGA